MFRPTPTLPLPSFEQLESDAERGRRAIVVLAGLDLGLFKLLEGERSLDAAALSARLEVGQPRLEALLEALTSLGYLTAEGSPPSYCCAPEACRFLCPNGRESRTDELLRLVRMLRGWSWLSEVIREDQARVVGSLEGRQTPRRTTHRGLASRGRKAGRRLVEQFDLGQPRTILDLGGGTGGFTRALLEALPEARATLFDRPEVIEMASRALTDAGVLDRVELLSGDFLRSVPPGPYDLVLLANVLHIYDKDTAADLVVRAAGSVGNGGCLVVRDAAVEGDRQSPTAAVLFGIHVAVFTDAGRVYSTDDIEQMMRRAGLGAITTRRDEPESQSTFIVGRRP